MPSRRSALQLFGASAALVTPVLGLSAHAVAADAPGSKSILTLGSVPIAWPLYYRLENFELTPRVGSEVFLTRDVAHPSRERGISVALASGETLGYVTEQHHAALDWALQRAGRVDARIMAVDEPVVRGRRVPGWGAFRISVDIREGVAAV